MDLCRLCSMEITQNFCKSIFQDDDIKIIEIIGNLTGLSIVEDDRLPKFVCFYCYEKLINFNKFRESVLQNELNFHQKLQQNCDNSKENTTIDNTFDNFDNIEQIEIKIVEEIADDCILLCNVCGKSFRCKSTFNRHIDRHMNTASYQCEICGKTFDYSSSLKKHSLIHNRIRKPYQCCECNRTFAYKETLIQHKRGHTGEKPFICDICGRRFAQQSHLSDHILLHNGRKPFICTICNCSFRHRTSLKLHINKQHYGKKTFICNVCCKGFYLQTTLNRHLKIHNKQKPFVCQICNKGFTKKAYLQTHLIKLHNK